MVSRGMGDPEITAGMALDTSRYSSQSSQSEGGSGIGRGQESRRTGRGSGGNAQVQANRSGKENDNLFVHGPYNRRHEEPRVMNVLAAKVMKNEFERIRNNRYHRNRFLSPQMVREIRASTGRHELIAAKFGISRQHVGQLKLRHTRKEVA